jgi:hypothetical protein
MVKAEVEAAAAGLWGFVPKEGEPIDVSLHNKADLHE